MNAITIIPTALFSLGQIVASPGAIASCSDQHRMLCLARHVTGDWGSVCAEDAAGNDEALKEGSRVLPAYPIDPGRPSASFGDNTLWIIIEADRSVTTFLLPDEY